MSFNPKSFFHLNLINRELTWQDGKLLLNNLAIVVSPHQDDESISMGGCIAKLVASGYKVHIIYITVEKRNEELNTDPIERKAEAIKALSVLGIKSTNSVHFLNLPDGNLKVSVLNYSKSAGILQSLVSDIEKGHNIEGHTLILTTSRYDAHRDHEETFNLIKNGLRKKVIMEFPTVNHMSSNFNFNCVIDISNYYSVKKRALEQYKGEILKRRILWDEIDYLDKCNGEIIDVKRAESCFISWFGLLKINLHY